MTGFSSKISLLALFLSAGVAFADPPHDTGPALGVDGTPSAPVAQDPDFAESPQPDENESTVHEATISAPPIDGFGTLSHEKSGLAEDIWKGSTRETAEPLLRMLRAGAADPTLQDLLTRLLLTQAPPPQGAGDGQSWFAVRVRALVNIGQDGKAEEMIASLPASMTDASLYQTGTELKLLRGESDKICDGLKPDALPADNGGEPFWQKLNIFCKAVAGKQDEALLGIDLLREERHEDDPFFSEAIRKIGDKSVLIKANSKRWSPLDIALLRASGDTDKLRRNVDTLPPVALKSLAKDERLDVTLREKITARLQDTGALSHSESGKTPEQPFARALASDVTTLVTALGSGKPANDADNAVIARLALDDAGIGDIRRVQRLLTLMEPFGYVVTPDTWRKLLVYRQRYDGDTPPAAMISRMLDAANTGRRGEAVVLASVVTGGVDLAHASDLALLPVVKALMAAGFTKEARSVAFEAVKGYNVR